MNRLIIVVVLLLCVVPVAGRTEDVIQKGELLNLDRCIEIALIRQPGLSAARSSASSFESRIGEAKANYYPQINGTAGYSRISSASSGLSSSSSDQVVGSSGGAFNQYSAGFSLSQNIYDFGRTSTQVKISNLNYNSALTDLENVTQVTILNVKQAYFGVLQAKRSRDVNVETVKQFELHLEQAKGFYEVGTKPKFDVTKAEVDLSNARLNLIKAGNAYKIAIVNLNNAMGVPSAPEYAVEDNLLFKKYDITLEGALSRAFENRPDLQSAVTKRKASEVSIDSAKSNYYPFLTGSASYNWSGDKVDSLDHGWAVGATVTLPIFSGFLTKHQVEEARSNLNVLKANEESLRQAVILEVQQAYLNLKQAEESVPTAELGVKQAQENMDIANGRYAAGVGNPIEVADAEVLLANAKLSYIQALYSYKTSQASLEKAMGMR
ncbi:MAG TPA: TolC family protein [Thermodesulfovibrionales bacterium]|nr:TolC family protein [Thermodesulfovibrionales bacterium]